MREFEKEGVIGELHKYYYATVGNAGFPSGWGIAIAGTILFAPTVKEIGTTVQIWTTGMPALSISFTIVAPQRVQVPHVLVRITASTPSATNSFANVDAYFFAFATEVPLPTVATVICGDSYFNENLEEAKKEVLEMVKNWLI